MHRPVQSGGRRSTAVSQTTELRCVIHGTSPGQPSELPQTRKEKRCTLGTLWKVVDFALVSSFRQTRRPIKPSIMRHSIYHKDASPPRPIYGFKVYCSCTGTVVVVGTRLCQRARRAQRGYAAQPTSHPRRLALEVKRPRGENDHSPPPSGENEWSYTSTSPKSSWCTQDRYVFIRTTPRLPAFFLRRHKGYKT